MKLTVGFRGGADELGVIVAVPEGEIADYPSVFPQVPIPPQRDVLVDGFPFIKGPGGRLAVNVELALREGSRKAEIIAMMRSAQGKTEIIRRIEDDLSAHVSGPKFVVPSISIGFLVADR